jgi:uncharacterized integral membrane protein
MPQHETATRPTLDAAQKVAPAVDDAPRAAAASATAPPSQGETRGARFSRKARRTRFHLYAFFSVALLVCLIALVAANTRQVKLSWVVGSSTASLVWIVLAGALIGWLLGVVSGAVFRWRTRAPRA